MSKWYKELQPLFMSKWIDRYKKTWKLTVISWLLTFPFHLKKYVLNWEFDSKELLGIWLKRAKLWIFSHSSAKHQKNNFSCQNFSLEFNNCWTGGFLIFIYPFFSIYHELCYKWWWNRIIGVKYELFSFNKLFLINSFGNFPFDILSRSFFSYTIYSSFVNVGN